MFQRNALKQLRTWATKGNRKPLILRGARQVGKTTLVNEFSKDFDTYLYINLEDQQAAALFDSTLSVDNILTAIFLYCNKPRKVGKTLLFIDEIQNSPQAVAKLRYFFESLPELYVIAAGSLLESLIDVHISFPVGRVEYMAIRPCTFIEFLGALGENELVKVIEEATLPEVLHSKVMQYFNTYTLIGGMPEVVAHYVENKDLVSINDIYETLLQGYKDDVEKYSKNQTHTNVIRHILNQGWAFAAQSVTLAGFAGSAYKSREMGEAFRTLEKTMLIELVYPSTGYILPIYPELKRTPKLIWLDTGLVNYSVKLQKELFGAKDILDAWRGHIAEQIVAQELLAIDYRVSTKRNFWVREKKGSDAEVDFIIQYDNKVIPIEVKSGHNAKLKSLHIFMEGTNHDIAIRVWSNPFSIDEIMSVSGKKIRLINLPFYSVGSLFTVLQRVVAS
ncbi:MAG: AAA family ATPase [Bacteroidales bacterium]